MKQIKNKLLSLMLIFIIGISMSFPCVPVYATTYNTENYVNWKNNAIIYPQAGQLVAAGPIYLQWNKLDDAIKYDVYIDDNFQGYIDAADDNVIEYEVYSTSVASHKLKIVAELENGKHVTANIRTFYVSKKGMGSGMIDKVQESGLSWYYHWATDPIEGADSKMQFVPMIWGEGEYGLNWLKDPDNKKYKTVLGFNEPDFKDQSNMSVDKVIEAWPSFMDSGLRVGSPATGVAAPWSDNWFKPFMDKIDADSNLNVDFIAIHCYLDGTYADTFLQMIDDCYEKYHKPIWITEFGIAEWSQGKWNSDDSDAVRDVAEFMKKVIPALDQREYVERYAWFPFDPKDKYGGASGLYDVNTGKLNSLGKVYRNLGNPKGYTLPNLDGSVDSESIPKDIVVDDGYAGTPTDPEEETSTAPKINGTIYTSTTTVEGTAGANADITLSIDENVVTTTAAVTTGAQAVINSEVEEKEIASTKAYKNGDWSVKIPAQKKNTIIKVTAKEEGKLESSISVKVCKCSSSSSGSGSSGSGSSGSGSSTKQELITTNNNITTIKSSDSSIIKTQILSSTTPIIKAELSDQPIVKKFVFEALAGNQNKILILVGKNASWKFNGSDISVNNVSDVDTTINSTSPNALNISELTDGKEIINLSFVNKDMLPGKATIEANVDSKYNNKIMYLYSYNMAYNRLNLISANVPVKNGLAEFDVTKGADYILSESPILGAVSEGWNKTVNGDWIFVKNQDNVIGWIKDKSNWYLTDNLGIMQTGWVKDTNGQWYFLNLSGTMQIGWIKETDGQWYYLNSNGAMESNTVIDGYKLDITGALIK